MVNKAIKAICISACIIFLLGITLILKSDEWSIGSYLSMNLAGTLLCLLSGSVIIVELDKK